MVNRYDRFFPNYPDDSDFTTNAPSYYEDLARKQKLIKLLAKRIWEYENTLNETLEDIEKRLTDYIAENDSLMNERLENWDKRIDEMPEEMRSLFVTWLNDGTLEQIINHDVLGNKADKSYVDDKIDQLSVIVPLPSGEDDTSLIQEYIDKTASYGTLYFPPSDTPYIINDSLIIDKPMTIKGSKGTWLKHKDQSDLFHHVGNSALITVLSSHVTIDGLYIDGNSRNNYSIRDGQKIYYEDNIRPYHMISNIRIVAKEETGDDLITNTVVKNCYSYDACAGHISAIGGLDVSDPFDLETPVGIDGVLYENNTVVKGQRSVLNFTRGVRNGVMKNNRCINNYWTVLSLYFQTINCSIDNNYVYFNGDEVDTSLVTQPSFPITVTGIRVNHATRAVGTVFNTIVSNNHLMLINNHDRSTTGIVVGREVEDVTLTNNNIYIKSSGQYASGRGIHVNEEVKKIKINNNTIKNNINHTGIMIRNNVNDIVVSDNIVESLESNAFISENVNDIIIESNTLKSSEEAMTLGIGSTNIILNGNIITGKNAMGSISESVIWKGEMEQGGISDDTGLNVVDNSRIRSIEYIPAFSNTTYRVFNENGPVNCIVHFYDSNKEYIHGVMTGPEFRSRNRTRFIKIKIVGNLENDSIGLSIAYNPTVPLNNIKPKNVNDVNHLKNV